MSKPDVNEASVRAAMLIVAAIGEAIRDLGTVPSGELYQLAAAPHGISVQDYNMIIDVLKGAKMVREGNHLLTWIGPKRADAPKTFEDGRVR